MSSETQVSLNSSWNTQYQNDMDHLDDLMDEGKVFEAVEYISTSIFGLFEDFTEDYLMGTQANTENDLAALEYDRNQIEDDFDSCSSSDSDANTQSAQEALDAYHGAGGNNGQPKEYWTDSNGVKHESMLWILTQGEQSGEFSSSFVSEVESQFYDSNSPSGTVFQGYGETSASGLAKCWNGLWNPSEGDSSTTIQVVTNPLDAASSDLSSQSSIVNSMLQTYESWDTQYQSIQHDMFTEVTSQEQAPNRAMQSASS